MLTKRMAPKSNLINRSRHRASLSILSVRFKIHFDFSRSVQIVNCMLSRYGRKRMTAESKAKNLRCVISFLSLASVNDRVQYPMLLVVLW